MTTMMKSVGTDFDLFEVVQVEMTVYLQQLYQLVLWDVEKGIVDRSFSLRLMVGLLEFRLEIFEAM